MGQGIVGTSCEDAFFVGRRANSKLGRARTVCSAVALCFSPQGYMALKLLSKGGGSGPMSVGSTFAEVKRASGACCFLCCRRSFSVLMIINKRSVLPAFASLNSASSRHLQRDHLQELASEPYIQHLVATLNWSPCCFRRPSLPRQYHTQGRGEGRETSHSTHTQAHKHKHIASCGCRS